MFRNAIVRLPAASIVNGLTSADLGKPDYVKALKQHSLYTDLLRKLGLTVEVLPGNDQYPDSTFIEDVALCTKQCAVITSPGAVTRRGETEGIRMVLSGYYENIESISLPGTIEAGDIMMAGDHFYIGISERTNNNGADQMIKILNKYGMTGSKVALKKMLHLKSGASYLENNTMLVCGEFADNEAFKKYNRIEVDSDESYAANSLWINGKVIVPKGYPKTREKIERAGYETITLDVSEFRKVDGGLSCLSLRF
ncbi:MAG: N(G),N(G)-dimethylarginine dimethylaminohydrolase [Bacteroidales bacterium]|nr:N(G),N(G)-dimethylarginine dimethylaminohydrolase [Bacteroidales bacterium]